MPWHVTGVWLCDALSEKPSSPITVRGNKDVRSADDLALLVDQLSTEDLKDLMSAIDELHERGCVELSGTICTASFPHT